MNIAGISYAPTGNDLTITINGASSSKKYTVVVLGTRGVNTYDRWTEYVISNVSLEQTFNKLVGKKYLPLKYVKKIETQKVSLSGFILHLATDCTKSTAFREREAGIPLFGAK